MVKGDRRVPANSIATTLASNSRLTRSSWRTWPQRKLRRKVPRVDGALIVPPRVRLRPPVRNASASSMQSPASQRGSDQVSSLVAGVGPPGAKPSSRRYLHGLGQAEVVG